MAQLCIMADKAESRKLDPKLLPVMTARFNHLYLAVRHSPPSLLGTKRRSNSFWIRQLKHPLWHTLSLSW